MRLAAPGMGIAAALMLLAFERNADAEPQATAGLTLGVAGVSEQSDPLFAHERSYWDSTAFHLGLRGDVLFGRTSNSSFGVGPYIEGMTHNFDDLQAGGGAAVLLPIHEYLPLVLGAGGYIRRGSDAWGGEPGLAASLFWGSRSYNYDSSYVMSGGLLLSGRQGLGDSKETAIVVAAQIDLAVLSMPFLFLYNAVRGTSSEAAPVK